MDLELSLDVIVHMISNLMLSLGELKDQLLCVVGNLFLFIGKSECTELTVEFRLLDD